MVEVVVVVVAAGNSQAASSVGAEVDSHIPVVVAEIAEAEVVVATEGGEDRVAVGVANTWCLFASKRGCGLRDDLPSSGWSIHRDWGFGDCF